MVANYVPFVISGLYMYDLTEASQQSYAAGGTITLVQDTKDQRG